MTDNKKNITEMEMDEETTQNTMRAYEDDILGGLLAAANFKKDEDEFVEIEVARKGVVYFKFRIRPLSEDEYVKCKERFTTYVRNKQIGIKVPEDTDSNAYRSSLIYEATVEEDRKKLWDNREAQKKLDVLSGYQLISKVLKPGEKDAILNKLDEISGYSSSLEEVAKN